MIKLNILDVSKGEVIGFINTGGQIFVNMGKMLIFFYQVVDFCVELLNEIRILEDLTLVIPTQQLKLQTLRIYPREYKLIFSAL